MAVAGAVPYIWFDNDALGAVEFYCALFPGSRIVGVSYYRDGAPLPPGTVLVVEFEMFDRPFAALNGGPRFPQSEAFSLQVVCDTQEEIDRLWEAITANGGAASMCGWCKDRWGVSWQIVPRRLVEVLAGDDPVAADRAWSAMITMQRLDLASIEAAVGAIP